jgi:hypothetical protein
VAVLVTKASTGIPGTDLSLDLQASAQLFFPMAKDRDLIGIRRGLRYEDGAVPRDPGAEAKLLAKRPAEMRGADKTVLTRDFADRKLLGRIVQQGMNDFEPPFANIGGDPSRMRERPGTDLTAKARASRRSVRT